MPADKRLLILCRHPAKASFRQRVGAYLPALNARGVATEVMELASGLLARRRQLRTAGQYDGIWLQKKTLTAWDAMALKGRRAKLIYDFDDAIMYKTRPDVADPDPGRARKFRRTAALADLVIAGNSLLADEARQAGAKHVTVVPTGLDIGRYEPKRDHGRGGALRLVWIGSSSTLKQIQSFLPVFEAIGQRAPGTILRIIADAGLSSEHITVENLPWSREGEAAMLTESDIGVSPLPDTPFTRGKCEFKIVQYLAAGLPVIASPVGANAEYVRQGQTGLQATTPAQWLEAFDLLAGDAALRARLGAGGREFVEQQLDRDVLGPMLCDAIAATLSD